MTVPKNSSARPRRILIGLRDIAGYGSTLKRGFDEIGVPSDFLNLGGSQFTYAGSKNSFEIDTLNAVSGKLGSFFASSFILRAVWLLLVQPILGLYLLPFILIRFDRFILLAGSTFFFGLELPLFKILGKKTLYVYLGSDSRPAYLNGYATGIQPSTPRLLLISALAWIQKITIGVIDRFATQVINTSPQALFHSREFLDLFQIGLPVDLSNEPIVLPKKDKFRILHAPSKSVPKRSSEIEAMITQLQKEGFSIEYVKIQGRPNHEVLLELANCDLVIDEMYSDTPLSKIASEAASFGKASLVGSYYAQTIEKDLPAALCPPSFFCRPEEMKSVLKTILENPESARTKGLAAKAFVTTHWSKKAVAEKMLQAFAGSIPQEWKRSPHSLLYVKGCGLSEKEVIRNVSVIYRFLGRFGLHLEKNSNIERRILALIKSE